LILLAALLTPAFGQASQINCYNEGIALAEQGKYDEAIEYFDSAIKINPQDAKVWYNKGLVLFLQGKYAEAIDAYNNAINLRGFLFTIFYRCFLRNAFYVALVDASFSMDLSSF